MRRISVGDLLALGKQDLLDMHPAHGRLSMKKNIDAVKMMREIRDELSQRYLKNPEQQKQDLKKIRDKYPPKSKTKSWKNKQQI